MTPSQRHDHRFCPIAGHQPSDAGACVIALDTGIYCHRCASKGLNHPDSHRAGYVPYTSLIGGVSTILSSQATNRVHWTHARFVLGHHHPNLSDGALRSIYNLALLHCHAPGDLRLRGVFNDDLNVVYSTQGWLDAVTFRPTEVDNDLIDAMPMAQVMRPPQRPNRPPEIATDRARRSTIKCRSMPWMIPLRPYRGISLAEDPASIPVEIPPRLTFPIKILNDPVPLDEAFRRLQVAFPKLNRDYLMAALGAMICAECGSGQPPAIVATGPAGSGKGVTIDIAASFLGDTGLKLQLLDAADAFMRQVGTATAKGHRALVIDEMGKIRDLEQKMANLFQIGNRIDLRLLYQSSATTVTLRSALFFPCVRFPDAIRNSPEFLRRTRCIRLRFRTPNWAASCGGDAAQWRHATAANALIGNSILTHVYRLCREANFIFDGTQTAVANQLGLGQLDDDHDPFEREALRNLYRYATGSLGVVAFLQDRSFVRGWIDISSFSGIGAHLIEAAYAKDEDQSHSAYRKMVESNLLAADWNLILGFEDPPIAIDLQYRSPAWGMRFRLNTGCKRGTEVLNELLPRIAPPTGENAEWLKHLIGVGRWKQGDVDGATPASEATETPPLAASEPPTTSQPPPASLPSRPPVVPPHPGLPRPTKPVPTSGNALADAGFPA